MTERVVFLESDRLYLRPLEEADVEVCTRWVNDPVVRRHLMIAAPISLSAEREWVAVLGRKSPPSDIVLAIVLKADDRHIGNLGLHHIDWRNRRATTGTLIGEKDCWRQGYATEAKRLIIKYAFDTLGLRRLSSGVYADNEGSLKCQLKCGYVIEGRQREAVLVDGRWIDIVMLGLLADEWRKSRQ